MNTLSPPLLDVPNAMEFMLLYVIRDTECYTYRNTQDFCLSLLIVMFFPLTVLIIPSGSLEHVTALDADEFQIKNVSTAAVPSVEQWQMTICLPVMSIVASSKYQIVFFWHTECYLVHSVLILPVVPYCNWMPLSFDMVT